MENPCRSCSLIREAVFSWKDCTLWRVPDGGAVFEELYSVRKKQVEPVHKELCPGWRREETEEAGVAKRRCDGLGRTPFLVPLCLSGLRRIKRSGVRLSLERRR